MTTKLLVSVSMIFILMASSQAFAERKSDARDGLRITGAKNTNATGFRNSEGKGNGKGHNHGGGNGHGHGDDTPGHCRGNVSPC